MPVGTAGGVISEQIDETGILESSVRIDRQLAMVGAASFTSPPNASPTPSNATPAQQQHPPTQRRRISPLRPRDDAPFSPGQVPRPRPPSFPLPRLTLGAIRSQPLLSGTFSEDKRELCHSTLNEDTTTRIARSCHHPIKIARCRPRPRARLTDHYTPTHAQHHHSPALAD